jgi:hypothetical protein
VRSLLRAKCPVQDQDLLEVCASDNLALCELLCARFSDDELRDITNHDAQGLLCVVRDAGVLELLLNHGLSPFPEGQASAFLRCVTLERTDLLALMLRFCPDDVDRVHDCKTEGKLHAFNALSLAAFENRPRSARWLLEHGANPSCDDSFALRKAIKRGHLDMVQLLKCPDLPWMLQKCLKHDQFKVFQDLLEGQSVPSSLLPQVFARRPYLDWCASRKILPHDALQQAMQCGPKQAIIQLVGAGCTAPSHCFLGLDFLWEDFLIQTLAAARMRQLAGPCGEVGARLVLDYLAAWDEVLSALARS